MRRLLTKLSVVAALLLAPAAAHADDHPFTLRLEPGVGIPLTAPQSDRFKVGGDLTLKPAVGLTPYLDVGPSVSVLALPSRVDGVDAGTAWGLGASVRLKRPHDQSNTGRGFSAISPWVDVDGQYIRTGGLDRFGFMAAIGAAVPTSDARTVWVGPFLRYQDITNGTKVGYDSSDAHVLIVGLSVEFGASPVKKAQAVPPPAPPKAEKPKEEPKPVPKPQPKPDTQVIIVEMTAAVPFKVDSAVILPGSKETLAQAVAVAKKYADCQITVEGHASSEGPPEPYNQKLSERRAQAVVDYLKAQGVPGDHLTAKGFSSTRPAASNKTEAGRSANRRVEMTLKFVITKKGESK